jgi:hypothetical protein
MLETIAGKREVAPEPELHWLQAHAERLLERGIAPELVAIACTKPVTKDQLEVFVTRALGYKFLTGGIVMSYEALSEGNCVPMDVYWELYSVGAALNPDGSGATLDEQTISRLKKEHLLHGPRGGMKTLLLAALWHTLCWFCDGYSTTHSATEVQQANKALAYWKLWESSPLFNDCMKVNKFGARYLMNQSRAVLKTATLNGLNSEHTISISIDEVETIDLDLLNQAFQIQQGEVGSVWPSLVILGSTQKKPGLGMARLIKRAKQDGSYKYWLWNCWDVGEKCPEWRRDGLEAGCERWAEIIKDIKFLEDRMADTALDIRQERRLKELYGQRDALTANCDLCPDCQGRLIHGSGHLPIATLLQRIRSLDRDAWISENLCGQPARTGAVYERLSEENLTEDAIYRKGKRVIAGVDYGLINDPTIVVLACINPPHVDLFDEIAPGRYGGVNMFEEDLIPIFKELQAKYHIDKWIVDNSAIKLHHKMKAAGLNAYRASRQPIEKGADHVARLICDGTNFRRLRMHPVNCMLSYEQMHAYDLKKTGHAPRENQDDDYCDAVRYLCEDVEVRTGQRPQLVRRGHRPGITTGRMKLK